jgi:hypothetical protein
MRIALGLTLVLLSACAPAAQGQEDVSPSPDIVLPSALPSATPAVATATPLEPPLDPEGKTIVWAIYRSDALGISFEYPASSSVYGQLPGCAPSESPEGINLDQLGISAELLGATAKDAADAFIRRFDGLAVESRRTTTIGGNPAEVLALRSIVGGTAQLGRYGEAAFVANHARVYSFFWIAGNFQCLAARGWTGPTAYIHVIQTTQFLN